MASALWACQQSPKVRNCTLGIGTCECPPGDPQCGPKALIYSDAYEMGPPIQLDMDAVGAVSTLRGSSFEARNPIDFYFASTGGTYDVVVMDISSGYYYGYIWTAFNMPWLTYDWVNCGGRLIYNNYSYAPWEQDLLGITASSGFNTSRSTYADPASPAKFFTGVPSPLMPGSVSPWAPVGVEVTPNPAGSGFLAARFDSTSGPGAIAVTRNNRVIVNGFLPSDYQGVDNDHNGIPDIQDLYKNEILYLMSQKPEGLSCTTLETFDYGTWPYSPWVAMGASYGGIGSGCSHMSSKLGGFSDGGVANLGWYVRTDVTIGQPGQKLSMWFETPPTINTSSGSGVLLGFGSTGTSTWALYAATWSGNFMFLSNAAYTTYAPTAPAWVAQSYTASKWYRMELEFGTSSGAGTPVTGRLYDSDGVTLLNTVSTTLSGFAPGGIGFSSYGAGSGVTCIDNIKLY